MNRHKLRRPHRPTRRKLGRKLGLPVEIAEVITVFSSHLPESW